jgi:hypothetical protein
MNRFFEHSQVATTNNYNSLTGLHTLKIAVTITHKIKSLMSVFARRFLACQHSTTMATVWLTCLANCSSFITSGEPDRTHPLQGFHSFCSRMLCHENVFNSIVTKPVATRTCLTVSLTTNERSLWFHYPSVQASFCCWQHNLGNVSTGRCLAGIICVTILFGE